MSGNKLVWEQEWSSTDMKTVPGHALDKPSDEVVLFREFLENEGYNPPMKVVDIGCGKGRNSIYLTQEGYQVSGIDYINRAIGHSKNRALQEGLKGKVEFKVIDITKQWPFGDNSFDIALDSLTSVGLEKNERLACRDEMYRTLKKGGIALIRVVSSDDEYEKELMKKHPGPEPNSSIWPVTGKFQKNFTENELREIYSMFEIVKIKKNTKKALKAGKMFNATNWWLIIKKI